MARKQITTEKLKFKFAGPSRACAQNEWKLVPLNQILKILDDWLTTFNGACATSPSARSSYRIGFTNAARGVRLGA
jgi:hypothetical protein